MSDTPVFIMNDGRYVKEEHFDRVEKQLAEILTDADHWKSECNALQRMVHEARADIAHKDKLIEQMRDALKLALPEARSTHCEQTILAALAAERSE